MTAFFLTAISHLPRNDYKNICFSTHKHPICSSFPFFYNPFPNLIQNVKKEKKKPHTKNEANMILDASCVLSKNVFQILNGWGIILPLPTVI